MKRWASLKKVGWAGLVLILLCMIQVGTMRGAGSYTATKQFTLTVAAPLTISTASALTEAVAGQTYSVTFVATGGIAPYVWSVTSGSTLPAGLILTSAGVLSGTPTTAGTYTFSLTCTDGASKTAKIVVGN